MKYTLLIVWFLFCLFPSAEAGLKHVVWKHRGTVAFVCAGAAWSTLIATALLKHLYINPKSKQSQKRLKEIKALIAGGVSTKDIVHRFCQKSDVDFDQQLRVLVCQARRDAT